ncbi:MAG: hypothetical protein EAZ65_03690 [Verrucomicrobia bacterium]|nr:MAG: hypothetical protein EAZ65_03690 [Verrucomicrobiota bacterium]
MLSKDFLPGPAIVTAPRQLVVATQQQFSQIPAAGSQPRCHLRTKMPNPLRSGTRNQNGGQCSVAMQTNQFRP